MLLPRMPFDWRFVCLWMKFALLSTKNAHYATLIALDLSMNSDFLMRAPAPVFSSATGLLSATSCTLKLAVHFCIAGRKRLQKAGRNKVIVMSTLKASQQKYF